IVIVIGNSPIERYWQARLREAMQTLTSRVSFTWFNELSFEDMLQRAAVLPPRSAIFFGLLSVDAAGVTHEEGKVFARLNAVANVPMFSHTDTFFGRGIVGGPLTNTADVGRRAASVAVRILSGESPGAIQMPPIGYGAPSCEQRGGQRVNSGR